MSACVFSVLMLFPHKASADKIIVPDPIPGEIEICRPNPNVEVDAVSSLGKTLPNYSALRLSRVRTGISDGDLLAISFPGTFPFSSDGSGLRYTVDLDFGFSSTMNSDLRNRGITEIQLLQNGGLVDWIHCFSATACGSMFRLSSTETGQNPAIRLSGAYTIRYANGFNETIKEVDFVLP